MQLILPFPNLKVSARDAGWLSVANAGDYFEKRFWFYPFKTRLLKAHGVQDGYDVQIIEKKCWCGDGIWRGRDDDLPKHLHQPCWKCNGTGLYLRKEIELRRWLLNGTVFHEPTSFVVNRSLRTYKNTFDGLIKHDAVTSAAARRAMEKLLLRYEPKTFYELWLARWRSWKECHTAHWNWQIRRVNMLLSWKETEDVPF